MMITVNELQKYEETLGYTVDILKQMQLGEIKGVKGTDNKIKRHTEDIWIFLRYDSVHTHINKPEGSSEDTYKIWKDFREACDYGVKYGESRCEDIAETFDEEAAIDTVSSYGFMTQQVKTNKKPLSGEMGFTKTLETIADYICYARFDNGEQEKEHEELKKERIRLERLKKVQRKEKEEKRLAELKVETNEFPSSLTRKLKNVPSQYQVVSLETLITEDNGIIAMETPIKYTNLNFESSDIRLLEAILDGRVPMKDKHEKVKAEVLKQFQDEITSLENKPFNPDRVKQISWLKSEMRMADENLSRFMSATPVIDTEETIPLDSWNHLSMRDTEVYKALLEVYYKANQKYQNKPSTNFASVLEDFLHIVNNTEWSKEEAVIVKYILETGIVHHKDIQEELLNELGIKISAPTLSKWLNDIIPNKLLNTYEQQLENWIWTSRRKGKYKACSKCGEVKLAVDDRYFRKHPKGKLGLQSKCKVCENQEKLRK